VVEVVVVVEVEVDVDVEVEVDVEVGVEVGVDVEVVVGVKMITWTEKKVKLSEVFPSDYNPRKISEHDFKALKRSLNEFGQSHSIVCNKNMAIIGGHQTLKAAKELEWEFINISIPKNQIPKHKEKALNLALNRIHGEWDDDLLAGILQELDAEDILLSGFEEDEIDDILDEINEIEEDEVPETPEEPTAKLGDIYQLGTHRLMCGDATVKEDVDRLMDGKKADMVFTDPPYGVDYANKNTFLNSCDKGNRIQTEIKFDNLNEDDICKLWKKTFENIRDILAETNSYYIFGPQIQGMMMMMMMMMSAGLPYRHVIIWNKNNHVLGRCDYNYKHEPIFFGWTTKHKFYGRGEFKTSVWDVNKPHKNDLHPTMKPIRIIVNALMNSSKKNQICYDPFGGSGSTLIACEQTNRICYMMELDEAYIDVIITRWENLTNKKAVKII